MTPGRASALVAALLLATPTAAAAEGRFTLPLPAAELPDGVLTVKVVGTDLRDHKVGQVVQLLRAGPQSGLEPVATVPTGKDGRARFDGLEAAKRYVVQVEQGEQRHRSAPFPGPGQGGVRLLLSLGRPVRMGGQELPAGHPPTSMPAGHPPTAAHGAGSTRGAARLEPDPELAPDRLRVVVVRGKKRQPLAGARVTLTTEPGGEEGEQKGRPLPPTDKEGQTGAALEPDSRHAVAVFHDGLTYRSQVFSRPASAEQGLRATFLVFDRSREVTKLTLGQGSHWVSQVSEGAIRFMQVMEITNTTDAVVDPGETGLELPLPRGARNVELPDELRGLVTVESDRAAVRLVAPVPPGGLPLRVFYEVPFEEQTLELHQRQPLALAAGSAVVLINASDRVRLAGPSVDGEARQVERGTAYPLAAVRPDRPVEVVFTGLPHRDRRPLVVVLALAGLIGLWGVIAALGAPLLVRERRARRDRLLQQLVHARRQRQARGKKPTAAREELVNELKQVWEEPW